MALLVIETKEDSLEKLLAITGKETKYFLYAEEFNDIVLAINSLLGGKVFKVDGLQVFKAPSNTSNGTLESGDYCQGFVAGQFINANYLGGDITLLASFDI